MPAVAPSLSLGEAGADSHLLHASCIALDGRAALFLGPSGAGKSTLALQLMALGADLVSDDQCLVQRAGAVPRVTAPAPIAGLIEARGFGLLQAKPPATAPELVLLVDLGRTETVRLPAPRRAMVLGMPVRLVHNCGTATLGPAIRLYLSSGEREVP